MEELKEVLMTAAKLIKCSPSKWNNIQDLFKDAYQVGLDSVQDMVEDLEAQNANLQNTVDELNDQIGVLRAEKDILENSDNQPEHPDKAKLAENKVEYTYEQMATMLVQEQGLVKVLGDEISKLRAENAVLTEKLLVIRKILFNS